MIKIFFKGVVKAYYNDRGYGFITNKFGRDVFVHYSNIKMDGYKKLIKGQNVSYKQVGGLKGRLEARDVSILEPEGQQMVGNVTPIERNKAIEHDTEDKMYWCSKGEAIEEAFVKEIVPKLKRNIIIHPNKAKEKTNIDLYDLDNEIEVDLKTQNTPFFSAGKYDYDPQFTVTFNRKDYLYYSRSYPDAIIFFWVNWIQLEWKHYSVKPMYGVWEVEFSQLAHSIKNGEVPLHEYKHRVNDKVNALDSYLFDVRRFTRIL